MKTLTSAFTATCLTFFVTALGSQALAGLPSSATQITDFKAYDAMADKPVGSVQSGKVIKFLIDNRTFPKSPTLYYINGNYCDSSGCPAPDVALHRTWAEKHLKGFTMGSHEFNDNTYYTHSIKDRKFFAGRVSTYEKDGKLVLGVWFVEFDQLTAPMIQFALEQVKKTFLVKGYEMALVAYSAQQTAEAQKMLTWLTSNGFTLRSIADLMSDKQYEGLNVGEAWGFLNYAPADPDDLEADEIPVFTELPLDLSVVAATVTTSFQDIASHVNLKAKERKTPNMMVRDQKDIDQLKLWDRKPVHLVVSSDSYKLEMSNPEIVAQKLAEKINKPWKLPAMDMKGTILQYDGMCPTDPAICLSYGTRFGGKGSRLGFLAHPKVIGEGSAQQKAAGYRLTPFGFAVPTNYYKAFVDYNSSVNPFFKKALTDLINSEMVLNGAPAFTTESRKAKIAEVQELFLNAKFPPGQYEAIAGEVQKLTAAVAKRYPGEVLNNLKIRSSANVEDIDDFDGAGLHDSYSAKISKSDLSEINGGCQIVQAEPDNDVKMDVKPHSIACAIKATFGSLWNLRAIRERSFHRFDHRGAFMGLAILPAYGFRSVPVKMHVAQNSVVITRVLNTSKVYGYQVSSQVGDNLVTNPTPGTIAELSQMTFQLAHADESAMTVFRFATPEAGKPALSTSVLPLKTMQRVVSISRTVEEAYCRAKPDYFVVKGQAESCSTVSNSQRKPKSLDIEVKYLSNGEILFKQAREFTGR